MPSKHTVDLGDCISSLAKKHKFADHKKVYDHATNAKLKTDRPNPNVLAQGDVVTIPDRTAVPVTRATGALHKFKLTRPQAVIRLVVQDGDDNPLAGKKYKLTVDSEKSVEDKTGSDGKIEHPIWADAKSAKLELWLEEGPGIDGYLFKLDLGHLQHESDTTAAQARLLNLGFDCGGLTGTVDDKTKAAVRAFQKKNALTENGNLDNVTRSRLRELHEGA